MTKIDSNNSSPTVFIKKLEYPSEILQELHWLIHSKRSEIVKNPVIRRLIRTKQCGICQALPEWEVIYRLEGAKKVERYCNNCYNKLEESDSINPND